MSENMQTIFLVFVIKNLFTVDYNDRQSVKRLILSNISYLIK